MTWQFKPLPAPADEAEWLQERASIIAEGCGINQDEAMDEAKDQLRKLKKDLKRA